jgi:hypothetical protein
MNLTNIAKKTAQFAAYVVVISFISLGIFETLLTIISYTPSVPMFTYTLIFDEDLLFRIKPNCAPDINEMGYRDKPFNHEKSELQKRVLFLGDSFVMGHNVPPDETIAAALSETMGDGYEVFNMGVLAYGPDQSLVALLEHGLDLNPDMVILGIFAANDFQDIERNRLFSLDDDGRLIRNPENLVTENTPRYRTQFLFNRLQYSLQSMIDKENRFLSRKFEFLRHQLIEDHYDWELLLDPGSCSSKQKINLSIRWAKSLSTACATASSGS